MEHTPANCLPGLFVFFQFSEQVAEAIQSTFPQGPAFLNPLLQRREASGLYVAGTHPADLFGAYQS
jgi:hypothetical protein